MKQESTLSAYSVAKSGMNTASVLAARGMILKLRSESNNRF